MLPRHKRLTTELFNQVIEKGKIFHSAFFTLRAIKIEKTKNASESRIAATASKKYFKTAVERNKVRRRIYAALVAEPEQILARVEASQYGTFHCIILAKSGMLKLSKNELVADLASLFVKSTIIK